jgi:hypothetical protein
MGKIDRRTFYVTAPTRNLTRNLQVLDAGKDDLQKRTKPP